VQIVSGDLGNFRAHYKDVKNIRRETKLSVVHCQLSIVRQCKAGNW